MFTKISVKAQLPDWQKKSKRYFDLEMRDRLLDGSFYSHLTHSFYDEVDGSKPISLHDRRPSSQFRMPAMVARWAARKLFAGRHVPKLRHKDKKALPLIQHAIASSDFWGQMLEAAYRGSVGSVGVTFRVVQADDRPPNIALQVWQAKYCKPVFDDMGTLKSLRVQYVVGPDFFIDRGLPVDRNFLYWFIREWTADQEITYFPPQKDEWNPLNGYLVSDKKLTAWETVDHRLGFVPGHWFKAMSGGPNSIDGACIFENAIPISIELDYLLSAAARGTRYNCAPQLVTQGAPLPMGDDDSGQPMRSPAWALQFTAGTTSEDGQKTEGGDAKLLEMNGAGMEVALKLCEKLHDLGLEQIAAPRKDPQKVKGTLSGVAMERLDDDSHDFVMELRSHFGERGMLPLLAKVLEAAYPGKIDPTRLSLQWPQLMQPSAADVLAFVQAFSLAMNPLEIALGPQGAPKMAKPGPNGAPAPVLPDPPTDPPDEYMLITPDEARAFLEALLDLGMYEKPTEDVEQPDPTAAAGGDEGAAAAPEAVETA